MARHRRVALALLLGLLGRAEPAGAGGEPDGKAVLAAAPPRLVEELRTHKVVLDGAQRRRDPGGARAS